MAERIRTTLSGLRNLRRRIDQLALEVEDWPVVGALVSKDIARAERRLAKMLEKLAKAQESEGKGTGANIDADDHTVTDANEDEEDGDAGPTRAGEDEGAARGDSSSNSSESSASTARGDSSSNSSESSESSISAEPETKPKGHGRNGAGAYVNAKHYFHALLIGIIGGLCEACGVGHISRHREKLIVVVKGQPLFDA
jgi:hypothetical protein